MATAERAPAAGDDEDPVVATYSVFLKPQLPQHQRLLVLQYPNRVDKTAGALAPTELRIKMNSGMIEVDTPLDYTKAYDRTKGMGWGAALASSTKAKAGGSHGLAGGFGVGGLQGTRGRPLAGGGGTGGGRAGAASGGGMDVPLGSLDWPEAVRHDRVLRLQTLGGMCPPARSAEARWMIGVFDGGNLHLTPVNSMVHLRPQLHHIDAEADMDRLKHRDGGGDGAAGGRGGGGAVGPAARAIHMTIKSAGADGDEVVTETMADRLRAVQLENWTRMAYVGDDDENSWDVYNQTLFLQDTTAPPTGAMPTTGAPPGQHAPEAPMEVEGKGKGLEILAGAAADGRPLATKVPALRTAWHEDDLLQAISGIEKPDEASIAATAVAAAAVVKAKKKAAAKRAREIAAAAAVAAVVKEEIPLFVAPTPIARRGRSVRPAAAGAPAAATRGRGGRARQAGRGSAMEMD